MGFQSIVYGRIIIEGKYDEAKEIILNLGNDERMLRTEMFGLDISVSSYYENPMISFGATYKQIEYYWSEFILRFEDILKQLHFDTAKIQLETDLLPSEIFEIDNFKYPIEEKSYA